MRRSNETEMQRMWRAVTGRTPDLLTRPPASQLGEIRKADRAATSADLANRLGVSRRTLREWETGRRQPTRANAARIEREMRTALVDRRARTLSGKTASVTATVKIGQYENARRRTMSGIAVPEPIANDIAEAVKSGNEDLAKLALAALIREHTGQSEDYNVSIDNLGNLTFRRAS